jgi:hypothetical protein
VEVVYDWGMCPFSCCPLTSCFPVSADYNHHDNFKFPNGVFVIGVLFGALVGCNIVGNGRLGMSSNTTSHHPQYFAAEL